MGWIPEQRAAKSHAGEALLLRLSLSLAFIIPLCLFATIAVAQTDWIPQLVDVVRALPFVGPDRVATMENVFFTAQDSINQLIYDRTHAPIEVASDNSIAGPPRAGQTPTAAPRPAARQPQPTPAAEQGTAQIPSPARPLPIKPLILSDVAPGEGLWDSTGMTAAERANPPLLHTFFRPDAQRPYARAELVWIDLQQTQLEIVPGTVEPRPIDGIRGEGQIPEVAQASGRLLAAWNGGFLTIHGAYGMMVHRRLVAAPRDGFATLANYTDGSWRLGIWGEDVTMTSDLVSFRQNGPMLIDGGAVNQDTLLSWGKSVSGATNIWRSGIGITADGAIVFGIGNGLSAQTLGEALLRAGAVEAMQLDVNAWHVFFFTYWLGPDGLEATKLTASIPGGTNVYLKPFQRDFMYLTLK